MGSMDRVTTPWLTLWAAAAAMKVKIRRSLTIERLGRPGHRPGAPRSRRDRRAPRIRAAGLRAPRARRRPAR